MSKTTQSSTKHERKKEKRHKGSYPPRGWRGQLLAIALLCATTIVFIYVLSPGLRPELGRLTALADGLDALALRDWILSFGVFSPLAYFLVVVAQVIASPIPAGPVTVAGALVFGVWKGLALSMAGSTVGSVLVFVATRRWGEPLVIRLIGKEIFYKYIGRLDPNGQWLFAILLVPFMPDDAVCVLAGLSAVSLRRFVVLMVVGRLPGATLTALLASDMVTRSAAGWIVVGTVVVVVLVVGFVYREQLEFWILQRADDRQDPGTSDGESKRDSPR